MRLTNTLASWAVMSSSGSLPAVRSRWLVRSLWGALIGMVIALGTLGFFALLVDWWGLLPLTWRPVLGIGCLFGWLAGALYAAPTETE